MVSIAEAFQGQDEAARLEQVLRSLGADAQAAYSKYHRDTGIGAVSLDVARQETMMHGQPLDHSGEAPIDQAA